MKLEVAIKAWEDNEAEYLRDNIIKEAANIIINEVMRNQDHYGKTFREDLEATVKKIILKELGTDFKDEVKSAVAEEMSKRYLRTRQARELKEEFGICSDSSLSLNCKRYLQI